MYRVQPQNTRRKVLNFQHYNIITNTGQKWDIAPMEDIQPRNYRTIPGYLSIYHLEALSNQKAIDKLHYIDKIILIIVQAVYRR